MSLDDLLSALKKHIPPESIDGSDPKEVASIVMLEVEHTPVIDHPVGDEVELLTHPPEPVEVRKDGERYMLTWPKTHDFRFVDAESLKVMRARYIMVRNFYWRRLRTLGCETQQRVLSWYFPEGTWTPKEGSELAKAMGVHGEEQA